MRYEDILHFWFLECSNKQRWAKDQQFDSMVKRRFEPIYLAACKGELSSWRRALRGRLAEIIVLDQFSRNMYRDTPRAFESDGMALVLAQEAWATGRLMSMSADERSFMVMPYMHAESPMVQAQSVEIFKLLDLPDNISFAIRHKEIIDQFGRFPHRNKILGRNSTAEEIAFLETPGSGF